jgi:hypothetical protein
MKANRKAATAKRQPRGEAKAAPAAPEVGQPKDPAQRRAVVEAALARKKASTPALKRDPCSKCGSRNYKPQNATIGAGGKLVCERCSSAMPEPSKAPTSKAPDQRKERTFPQLEQAYARCNPAYLKDPKAARAPLALDWVKAQDKNLAGSRKIKAALEDLKSALKAANKAARTIDDLHPFQWGAVPSQEIVDRLGFVSRWTDQGLSLCTWIPRPKRGEQGRISILVAEVLTQRGEKEVSKDVFEAIEKLKLEGDDFNIVTLKKTLSKRRERERKLNPGK